MSSLLQAKRPWLLTFMLANTKPSELFSYEQLTEEFVLLNEQICALLTPAIQLLYINSSPATQRSKPSRIAQIISPGVEFPNGPVECELSDGKQFIRTFLTADAIQGALKGSFEGRSIWSQKGAIITVRQYRVIAVKAPLNPGVDVADKFKVGLRLVVQDFSISGGEGCGTVGTPEYCGNYRTCLTQLEERIIQQQQHISIDSSTTVTDDVNSCTQTHISQESSEMDGLHLICEQFSQTQQSLQSTERTVEKEGQETNPIVAIEPTEGPWKDFIINNEVLRLSEEAALLAPNIPFYRPRFSHLVQDLQSMKSPDSDGARDGINGGRESSPNREKDGIVATDLFVSEPLGALVMPISPSYDFERNRANESGDGVPILAGLIGQSQDLLDLQDIDDKVLDLQDLDDKVLDLQDMDDKVLDLQDMDDKVLDLQDLDDKVLDLQDMDDKVQDIEIVTTTAVRDDRHANELPEDIGIMTDIQSPDLMEVEQTPPPRQTSPDLVDIVVDVDESVTTSTDTERQSSPEPFFIRLPGQHQPSLQEHSDRHQQRSCLMVESSAEGRQIIGGNSGELSGIEHAESSSTGNLAANRQLEGNLISLPWNYSTINSSFIVENAGTTALYSSNRKPITSAASTSLIEETSREEADSPGIFRRSFDYIRSIVRSVISSPVVPPTAQSSQHSPPSQQSPSKQKSSQRKESELVHVMETPSYCCNTHVSDSASESSSNSASHMLLRPEFTTTPPPVGGGAKNGSPTRGSQIFSSSLIVPETQQQNDWLASSDERKPFVSALRPGERKCIEIVVGSLLKSPENHHQVKPVANRRKLSKSPPISRLSYSSIKRLHESQDRPVRKRRALTNISSSPQPQPFQSPRQLSFRHFPEPPLSLAVAVPSSQESETAIDPIILTQFNKNDGGDNDNDNDDDGNSRTVTSSGGMACAIEALIVPSSILESDNSASHGRNDDMASTAASPAALSTNDYYVELVSGRPNDEFRICTISSHSTGSTSSTSNSLQSFARSTTQSTSDTSNGTIVSSGTVITSSAASENRQSLLQDCRSDDGYDEEAEELLWRQRALAKQQLEDIENLYPATLIDTENSQTIVTADGSAGGDLNTLATAAEFSSHSSSSSEQAMQKRYLIFRPDCI